MKIEELERIMIRIKECDLIYEGNGIIDYSQMTSGMRDAIRFEIEKRKANLIDRIRNDGLRVEV